MQKSWAILFVCLLALGGCNSSDDPIKPSSASAKTSTSETISDPTPESADAPLLVGTAKADLTGPSALVTFMGMSDSAQMGEGIQMRNFASAFVFQDATGKKMAYVSSDIAMVFQGVKQAIVAELKDEGWSDANLMLQGTHTHGAPAGSSHYFMYNMASGGFVQENFDAQVGGIVKAIRDAEANLKPRSLSINQGTLYGTGWNRSPWAYMSNPRSEIEHYGLDPEDIHEAGFINQEDLPHGRREHRGNLSTGYLNVEDEWLSKPWNNTDKRMRLLKLTDAEGQAEMLSWFSLHPTTMGSLSRMISGDTHGYASYMWDREKENRGTFAQAACGDVSGNLKFGPPSMTGNFDWQHCKELGGNLLQKAEELYAADGQSLSPAIDYRHMFVDFSNVRAENGDWRTRPAATGASMVAGSTEDSLSPAPLFNEGLTVDDLSLEGEAEFTEKFLQFLFPKVLGVVWPASLDQEFVVAHYPKPIIWANGLNLMMPAADQQSGELEWTPWSPEVLPVQLLRVGELILCAMPLEVSTMAARRIENTIMEVFNGVGPDGYAKTEGAIRHVIINQCANAYAGYVTTEEEYGSQEYEGASTQFGPNELKAFQQEIRKLALSMKAGTPLVTANEPQPRNMNGTVVPELYLKASSWPKYDNDAHGQVVSIVRETVADGTEYLKLTLKGAFPNRNLMTGSSYMTVTTPRGAKFTDADPETRFQWADGGDNVSLITLWFDMTLQDEGDYIFTYTAEALDNSGKSHMIDKRYPVSSNL